jgi:hypothetical protein
MNKTVLRSLLFAAGILLLIFILSRSRSPFGKGNSSFSIESVHSITRIEISDGKQKLKLEKKGETWLLNGKSEARKSGVLFIIRMLQDLKIKSPVSEELFDSETTAKGIEPVKVKVFENRKLLKSFLVYKTRANVYGNIMKMKNSSKPFIVYVPGYDGEIGSGFTTNELFWQSYTVFNLLPSEISLVSLENFSDTASSFSIFNRNHKYSITNLKQDLTGWDSARVSRYLSYFTWIPFESWILESGGDENKIVESRQPLYRFSLITTDGRKIILTLWSRTITKNGVIVTDSDRLLGKTQSRDELFIMRYFDIDPLLKKRSYFFPKND